MKETYYAGYDPKHNIWDATPITHNFTDEAWVFRVTARSEDEAIDLAKAKLSAFQAPPSPSEKGLFRHIEGQVKRLSRTYHELMIIEVPPALIDQARKSSDLGFFRLANNDEILLDTSSVGWKAIEKHIDQSINQRKSSRHHHDEGPGVSF